MQQIDLTLTIIIHTEKVLLGMKKRGFGAGKWNGFGGKIEEGEHPDAAARRELQEEVGIEATDLRECGTLTFEYTHTQKTHYVTVYRATTIVGTPVETEEMRPQWFLFDDIPYESMWVDDPLWLPYALSGKRFRGRFIFEDDQTISEHTVTLV